MKTALKSFPYDAEDRERDLSIVLYIQFRPFFEIGLTIEFFQ